MATLYTELCEEDERQLLAREPNLDPNQKLVYERILPGLYARNPYADEVELNQMAADSARRTAPTSKQAAQGIVEMRNGPTYCYLAFYGRNGVGQYLKVGMTSHPEQRLYGIATGNPLDCLWVYAARFGTRRLAYAAEQSILRDMASHQRRGEWIEVEAGADEARSLARQMGGLVDGDFLPMSYRDGREAA